MTKGTATSEEAGKTCPYCRFPLKVGASVERCGACGTVHHAECWVDGRGCSVVGCQEGPTAQVRTRPLPVPAPPPHPEVVRPTNPPPPSHGTRNLLLGVGAGLLIAAAVVTGFLVTRTTPKAPLIVKKAAAVTPARKPKRSTVPRRRVLAIPGGVYRWTVTPQDLEAEGRSAKYIAENTGVMTMTLAGGVWTFDQRSATARHTVLTGQYETSPQVVSFKVTGPRGDTEIGEAFSADWRLQGTSVVLNDFSSSDWGGVMGAHPWRRVG